MAKITEFRILDLFCGAGGFSYGMHRNSHFKTAVAVDFNEEAANTFRMNMPETVVITGDLTNEATRKEVIETSNNLKVNMIIGGPPCQGFSMKGKKLGLEDSRNYLFLEYLKIVEEIKPEVFVIENVKSILSTAGGWFRDEIVAYIERLGYSVNFGILNAKEFGVPQGRERAIFICSRDKSIQLPTGNDEIVTVRDAISDLAYLNSGEGTFESEYITEPESEYQKEMRNGSLKLYNHKASNHSELAVEKLKMIPAEKGKEYLPMDMRGKQKFNTTWGRLVWDKVSPTIDTRFDTPSNGTNSHPELHRAITPREAARIQSFDDKFIFYGSKFYIRTQIGNAVPPLLAEAIANAIWAVYEENTKFADYSKEYESSLDDQYKKLNGIFYTDLELAGSIVNFLNIPKAASVIDPCCGTGSFLYMLKRAGIKHILGCDYDEDAIDRSKMLTGVETVYHKDTIGKSGADVLSELGEEKFDYVIGNPPYVPLGDNVEFNASINFCSEVRQGGNNLFVAALLRAFELAKPEGYISYIVPKNLLHISSYETLRKRLLKEKRLVSIVELGIHFKTVRGEQIVLTFQNQFVENNKVKFYSYDRGRMTFLSEIPQDFYENEILVFTSNKEIPIFKKLKKNYPTLKDFCSETIRRGRNRDGHAIRGKQIKKCGFKHLPIPSEGDQIFIQNIFSAEAGLTATFAGTLDASETVTVLKFSDTQMCKFILGLLNSRLCNYYLIRFIFNNSRLTIHTDAKYLNQIPIVPDTLFFNEVVNIVELLEKEEYMSKRWFELNEKLNRVVYDIYQLTPKEITYIENEMKKISSSKWYAESYNFN